VVCFIRRQKWTTSRYQNAFDKNYEHLCIEIIVDPRELCNNAPCIGDLTRREEAATVDKVFWTKQVEVEPTLDVPSENCNEIVPMASKSLRKLQLIVYRVIENNRLALCTYNGGTRNSILPDISDDNTQKEIVAKKNKDQKLLIDQQGSTKEVIADEKLLIEQQCSTKEVIAKVQSPRKAYESCWDTEPSMHQPKFKLHSATNFDGRQTLTQMEDFYRALEEDEDEAFDELGRQTLFADTYVKSVDCLPQEEQLRLLAFIDRSPAQITGTRWKVYAVLNEYLSLSWHLEDNTWTFDFTLAEFETQCNTYFGKVSPADALNSSILAFLREPSLYFS